jgi:hypothetical protein
MTPSGIYQVVHDRARAAGLPAVHPHQLRHAFATTWLAEGGNENELMLVAGWKSRMMIDRYTKATAAERARATHARLSPPTACKHWLAVASPAGSQRVTGRRYWFGRPTAGRQRKAHPYHEACAHRCVGQRFRWSWSTVGRKVICSTLVGWKRGPTAAYAETILRLAVPLGAVVRETTGRSTATGSTAVIRGRTMGRRPQPRRAAGHPHAGKVPDRLSTRTTSWIRPSANQERVAAEPSMASSQSRRDRRR